MSLKSVNAFALFMTASLVSACAGGGGGAGGGVVPPPVTPPVVTTPYASSCATTPGALSCQSGTIQVDGPQVWIAANGTLTTTAYEALLFNRAGTTQTSDDSYTFLSYAGATVVSKAYNNPQTGNDGLGPVRTAANVTRDAISGATLPGDGSVLTFFDITNVLQGGLDYVQLGQVSPPSAGGSLGFFAVARTPSSTAMPTTGSARFDGGTRGAYISGSGTRYATASDVTLTANFGTGAVTGSTSNFRMVDAGGATATQPHSLNFNFTANIAGSTFTGTASSPSMTGAVDGAFYGEPSAAPVEAGLSYRLTETAGGGMLIGVGGLKKN